MEKVKVLHCLHSLSWGGLEIYSAELIQRLAEEGQAHHAVLCAPGSRVHEELKKTSLKIHTFQDKKISKLSEALLIRTLLKENAYTHLHSHSRLDMWACSLALVGNSRIRHIYNLYMNATPKNDLFHRWLFSRVHALCSSSEVILQDVARNFPMSAERLHLIRYGRKALSSTAEKRQELRHHYHVKPGQIVIGSLCRMDPGKGVKEMIQALELLTPPEREHVQLWLVGDPTLIGKKPDGQPLYEAASEELNTWIEETVLPSPLGRHIKRIPFQKEYADYIFALDVFALASYNETYSLSVLDAMLMGKPVIATNRGGSIEQIGANERGILAEPQDPESLALCYEHYLRHKDDIFRQGRLAQEWALSRHSWQKTLQDFQDLYVRL